MKRRNRNYFSRQKALRAMVQFTDLRSFLMAGFKASRSLVVKKDIVDMLLELNRPKMSLAKAS